MNTAYLVLFNALERNCTQSKLIPENELFILPFCLFTMLTDYLTALHMAINSKGEELLLKCEPGIYLNKKITTDLGKKVKINQCTYLHFIFKPLNK